MVVDEKLYSSAALVFPGDAPVDIIADELVATVKTVDGGAITALTLSSNQAINDGNDIVIGREAKEFNNATYTTESAGTGATFKVHKCQRYAAWKVDVPRSPCGTA